MTDKDQFSIHCQLFSLRSLLTNFMFMKKALLLIACVSFFTKFVFGQPFHSTTSTKMNTYKHPLKTITKEKELNAEQPNRFKVVAVKSDAGFKHPFNRAIVTRQYLVPTKKSTKAKGGSKHPLGL